MLESPLFPKPAKESAKDIIGNVIDKEVAGPENTAFLKKSAKECIGNATSTDVLDKNYPQEMVHIMLHWHMILECLEDVLDAGSFCEINFFWPDFGVVHLKLKSDDLYKLSTLVMRGKFNQAFKDVYEN